MRLVSPKSIAIFMLATCLGMAAPAVAKDQFVSLLSELPESSKIIDPDGQLHAKPQRAGVIAGYEVFIEFAGEAVSESDTLTDARRKALAKGYAKTRAAVIKKLKASGVTLTNEYENIPGIAAVVDEENLVRLLTDADVVSIAPVRGVRRLDLQASPLIKVAVPQSEYSGAGVTVAVIDDGIDYRHAQLGESTSIPNSKINSGRDFHGDFPGRIAPDSEVLNRPGAHGTSVAGIIAGANTTRTDRGDYDGGVAPNAKISALKVFPDGAALIGLDSAVVAAIDWCVTNKNIDPANPILVINMSIGRDGGVGICDGRFPLYNASIKRALAAGISVVASSGNSGLCNELAVPACISGVISVGATSDSAYASGRGFCLRPESCEPRYENTIPGFSITCEGSFSKPSLYTPAAKKVTGYSNRSADLTIYAPGDLIYALDNIGGDGAKGGDFDGVFEGTSASAPFVAGAIALMQEASMEATGRYLSPSKVTAILSRTGSPINDPPSGLTKPFLDVEEAVLAARTQLIVSAPNGTSSFRPGDSVTVRWMTAGSINGSNVRVELLNEGRPVQLLSSSTTDDGTFNFMLSETQAPGNNYAIRITSTETTRLGKIEDVGGVFRVLAPKPPALVLAPNGGESYRRGTWLPIAWQNFTGPRASVRIELLKNGIFVRNLSASTRDDGSHSVRVPSSLMPGNDYTVRITSLLDDDFQDTSNGSFTIR